MEQTQTRGRTKETVDNIIFKGFKDTSEQSQDVVRVLVDDMLAQSRDEFYERVQRTIKQVEAGDAAGVGLEQAAAMQEITFHLWARAAVDAAERGNKHNVERVTKLGNLHNRITHQLKQSAAWEFRADKVLLQSDGVGRNLKKLEKRVLERSSSAGDGNWSEPL